MDFGKSITESCWNVFNWAIFYSMIAVVFGAIGAVIGLIVVLAVIFTVGETGGLSLETWLFIGAGSGAVLFNLWQAFYNNGFGV